MKDKPSSVCRKCGKRKCQFYGPVGGYSRQCKKCNQLQSEKRRYAARRRALIFDRVERN